MSGPSSTPRGERAPRPGITWQTELVRTEHVVDDDAPDPTPNRATRRAIQRDTRRTCDDPEEWEECDPETAHAFWAALAHHTATRSEPT